MHVTSSSYMVIKNGDKHLLVKIIGEYEAEKQAYNDMIDILMGGKSAEVVEKIFKQNNEI
ncbi:MAG TPA: hypothetical protein VEY68_04515 [Anoxybacillus sp.]|jgi:hypothetical protein|nr:hypothetical protein [Anoxybacillus sp.]